MLLTVFIGLLLLDGTLVAQQMSAPATARLPTTSANAATSANVSALPLEVRADVVNHWQMPGETDSEAYLLTGNCALRHENNQFAAEQVLLVIDGPPGRVRTRLAMSGVRQGDGATHPQPITATLLTTTAPQLSAPVSAGLPKQPPQLMRLIPDLNQARSHSYAQRQASPVAPAGYTTTENQNGANHGVANAGYAGPGASSNHSIRPAQFEIPNQLPNQGVPASGQPVSPGFALPGGPQGSAGNSGIPSSGLDISRPAAPLNVPELVAPGVSGPAPFSSPPTANPNTLPPPAGGQFAPPSLQPGQNPGLSPAPNFSPAPDPATNTLPAQPFAGGQTFTPGQSTPFQPTPAGPGQLGLPTAPLGLPGGFTGSDGPKIYVNGGQNSIQFLPRNNSGSYQTKLLDRPEYGDGVFIARGGVTAVIEDVSAVLKNGTTLELGTISVSADQIVSWGPPFKAILNGDVNAGNTEGELYLEGDIVLRQGDRIVYADAMYFNVKRRTGMILDAEAITTLPGYNGVVRLKADVMQQVSEGNFVAFDAAVTSSRMGVPRYWLQSEQLQLKDRRTTITNRATGETEIRSNPYISSRNNAVYVAGFPVLYWPRFGSSLNRRPFYLSSAKVKNDSIFGTQVMLEWDLFQIFGIENAPDGVEWNLSTDYLSDRGPAFGTNSTFAMPSLFGFGGEIRGEYDSWVLFDDGLDTLGNDRRDLQPEEDIRGRSLLRSRQQLSRGYELIAEIGLVSDRNFTEQFLENEWDQDRDPVTGLRLRHYNGNRTWDLSANAQVNDFFMETESLPEFKHSWIGASVLSDLLTWSAQSKIGYYHLNVADAPENAAELAKFTTLPGEVDAEGVIASTRQEIAMPLSVLGTKIVPYLSGDATYYGEAVDGNDLTRLAGQAGLRSSFVMSRIDPTIQSGLLNIRGLAHKMEWRADYFYADSNTDIDEIPYYSSLDDNSQEQFRRRFTFDTFAGTLPLSADPRNYAFRQGLQRWVTSPSGSVVDDTQQLRLGVNNRFQTKRGLPGRERITDLFQFDLETVLFMDEDENFGEHLGPTTYDIKYHLGDRVTLYSDGYVDFFDDGLRSISAGVKTSRPGVGDLYLGLLSLSGPVSSTVLRSSFDYRMNEKWIASAATTYDFGEVGNVGQSFGLTRIGESFLLRVGMNVDAGRDNVGFAFAVEPRFWPKKLGRLGGQMVLPPGIEGLE